MSGNNGELGGVRPSPISSDDDLEDGMLNGLKKMCVMSLEAHINQY
ncbi:hypothetical protein [Borreliella bavariensis]|nr:hypothetical protein [Borreliella bavariensis]